MWLGWCVLPSALRLRWHRLVPTALRSVYWRLDCMMAEAGVCMTTGVELSAGVASFMTRLV